MFEKKDVFPIAFEGPFNLKLRVVTSMIEASQHSSKPASQNALIKGYDIGLKFGEGFLLENVNFEVIQGESLVLIGPSGQGKSSLLKILAGILDPTSGKLQFEGENWDELSITQRNLHYRKRGMLFQKNALFDSMTVLENVCFPLLETTTLSNSEIEKRAIEILESVGLGHALKLFPDEMSGGMQKRLGIARALILEPPILLNDDPIAGLDPITSRKIIQLILDLKSRRGITVISVLNDVNRAYELATRIWMVMDTTIVDLGAPAQAQNYQNEKIQNFLKGEPS